MYKWVGSLSVNDTGMGQLYNEHIKCIVGPGNYKDRKTNVFVHDLLSLYLILQRDGWEENL